MLIDYNVIGANIRFYRLLAKMSQETLAERADVSRVFISCLERGEKPPSLDTILCLASALHTSVDELLSGAVSDDSKSIHSPFFDCSPEEFDILIAMVRNLKSILRQYKITE